MRLRGRFSVPGLPSRARTRGPCGYPCPGAGRLPRPPLAMLMEEAREANRADAQEPLRQVNEPGSQGWVEPPTFRSSGAFARSLHVAGCGLMGDLAAQTMAGCCLMWPELCRRWLPVWLPTLVSSFRGRRCALTAFQTLTHEGSRCREIAADGRPGSPATRIVAGRSPTRRKFRRCTHVY